MELHLLLLYNKLPQNVMAWNNTYYLIIKTRYNTWLAGSRSGEFKIKFVGGIGKMCWGIKYGVSKEVKEIKYNSEIWL